MCYICVILIGAAENFEKCLSSVIVTQDYNGSYEIFALYRVVGSGNVVV